MNFSVWGSARSDAAKMIGMTPPALTRKGRKVLWPPYTLRPTIRLAYWMGILR